MRLGDTQTKNNNFPFHASFENLSIGPCHLQNKVPTS